MKGAEENKKRALAGAKRLAFLALFLVPPRMSRRPRSAGPIIGPAPQQQNEIGKEEEQGDGCASPLARPSRSAQPGPGSWPSWHSTPGLPWLSSMAEDGRNGGAAGAPGRNEGCIVVHAYYAAKFLVCNFASP